MKWVQGERSKFFEAGFVERHAPTFENSPLLPVLKALSGSIKQTVAAAISSGELVRTRQVYRMLRVSNVRQDERGGVGFVSSESIQQRTEWIPGRVEDFVLNHVQSLSEFEACKEAVEREFPKKGLFAALRFANEIALAVLEDQTAKESEIIYTLLNDLSGGEREMAVVCYVQGLWLDDCEEMVADFLKIRKLLSSDLECERGLNDHRPLPFSENLPSAIIEFRMRGRTSNDATAEANSVLNAFRLFRLGSVRCVQISVSSHSVISRGTVIDQISDVGPRYRYSLKSSDGVSLSFFLSRTMPTLRAARQGDKPKQIALSRYCKGLTLKDAPEARLTAAISSFEAIFLQGEQELGYKLSLRVATMLRIRGLNAIDVRDDLKKAYSIRSKYIHGNKSDAQEDLCQRLFEYLRVSLQIVVPLATKKDALLGMLDDCLVDVAARERMEKLVKSVPVTS